MKTFALLLLHVTAASPSIVVGRLRYVPCIAADAVGGWSGHVSDNTPAFVFEVEGKPCATLLVKKTPTTTVATRMIYDATNVLETVEYFPMFRALVHKHIKDIDLTHLPEDERLQFLCL